MSACHAAGMGESCAMEGAWIGNNWHFLHAWQDAISRVQTLEEEGRITGVMDDRGKFIYISRAEMAAVAEYIQQRGRVAIGELAAMSASFIDFEPKCASWLASCSHPGAARAWLICWWRPARVPTVELLVQGVAAGGDTCRSRPGSWGAGRAEPAARCSVCRCMNEKDALQQNCTCQPRLILSPHGTHEAHDPLTSGALLASGSVMKRACSTSAMAMRQPMAAGTPPSGQPPRQTCDPR